YTAAVMLLTAPIFIVPLPRNLELPDPCSGTTIKLKDALVGCGEQASGPELLAILVEDFTGIAVDHYVVLNFAGFAGLVDAMGGVEICVPYAVRDRTTGTGLDLPEGCTNATGEQALGWVTSRTTEALIDGEWVALEGVSSLDRDQRILDLMFKVMAKAKRLSSPGDLLAIADQLSGTFILDEGLSVTDAVALAWELRGTPLADIVTFTIPAVSGASEEGEFILSPAEPFIRTLEREYPAAESWRVPVQP
ncbi:MAG: LCP family protein, partial [Acidimicrobiia bacterium]